MNNKSVLGFLILLAGILAEEIIVTIPDGAIKGTQRRTTASHPYYAFFAVRYAKPPTGVLRFQTPVPVDRWSGIYDATYEKNICYQVGVDSPDENEDCLTLSVYTATNPLTQIQNKLPVMVFIHGGGFFRGSGYAVTHGQISPGYIMDNQLVMVSINYRLGPFGFLSTGDKIIPGNAGLKDQTLALKWIQKNIAFFGGDPNKVTLFGQSAGAASIAYQLLSPSAAANLKWILSVYDLDHSFLVPHGMHITDPQTKSLVGDLIQKNYSPNSNMEQNLLSGIQFITDHSFQKSLFRHAELQSQHTDVYFYIFSYSGNLGGNLYQKYPGSKNVTHIEEENYLFDRYNIKLFPQTDQLVHQRIVKLWINFATYKNPTPKQDPLLQNITWPKVSQTDFQYVDIGADLQVLKDPKKEKYSFWKNLYDTYGKRPFDIY